MIGIDPRGSVLRQSFYTKKVNPELKTYKVEGIGQDYVPDVLNFDYVDEVIEVTDTESFLMARRLTREEGIFAGGSSGSAVAGMLKIAKEFKQDDLVVVLLPDSGDRYLSKIYNDDWMREYGFLVPERITIRYLLESKGNTSSSLVAIEPGTTVRTALTLIKEHDISQIPVINAGKPVGAVNDNELMAAVLERPALLDSPVRAVMGTSLPSIAIDAPMESAIRQMTSRKNSALLVKDKEKVAGIITRYDVIEYMRK